MCHKLLKDANLYRRLFELDIVLAEASRRAGCGCGARLHRANYPRKPRGPASVSPGIEVRFSFCCSAEGCRKRKTPPSVRFLGRRVYWAAVVVLLTAVTSGMTPARVARLRALIGVDRRTLARWVKWWRDSFPRSTTWRARRDRLLPPVDERKLPSSLLGRFTGDQTERLVATLSFLVMAS